MRCLLNLQWKQRKLRSGGGDESETAGVSVAQLREGVATGVAVAQMK